MLKTLCWVSFSFLFIFFTVHQSFAGTNEGSFTPTSILVPIRAVVLEYESEDGETTSDENIYECDDDEYAESGCLVELKDKTATNYVGTVINGENSVTVDTGTYNRIDVQYCNEPENSYTAKLKGSVTLGGTTYYTSSTEVLTTDEASMDYVEVEFSGRRSYNIIPSSDGSNEITISEGDELTFSMLVENTNIAWAKLGEKTIVSGCTENEAQDKSVCLSYPHPVPYLGTVSDPDLKIWHIDETLESGDTGGQVLLVFTEEGGDLIGGFTRRYFSETSEEPSGNYDTQFKTTFDCNTTTCDLENYGTSATNHGYLQFLGFEIGQTSFSSSGFYYLTCESSDEDEDGDCIGAAWQYTPMTATLQE